MFDEKKKKFLENRCCAIVINLIQLKPAKRKINFERNKFHLHPWQYLTSKFSLNKCDEIFLFEEMKRGGNLKVIKYQTKRHQLKEI